MMAVLYVKQWWNGWNLTRDNAIKLGRVPLPHAHHVVLPANHLAQDQHDRNGGQTHEQEQRVCALHHVQALFVAYYLHTTKQTSHRECVFVPYYLHNMNQTHLTEGHYVAYYLHNINGHISEQVFCGLPAQYKTDKSQKASFGGLLPASQRVYTEWRQQKKRVRWLTIVFLGFFFNSYQICVCWWFTFGITSDMYLTLMTINLSSNMPRLRTLICFSMSHVCHQWQETDDAFQVTENVGYLKLHLQL